MINIKVKQLISCLQDLDPNQDILMAIDPEGNGYYSLIEVAIYDEGFVSKAIVLFPAGDFLDSEDFPVIDEKAWIVHLCIEPEL